MRRVGAAAGDDEDRAIIEEIIKAVEAAHTPRNELAHGFLTGPGDGDPGKPWQRVSLKAMNQGTRPVTTAYLKSLTEPSSEAVRMAHAAFDRLCQKRGVASELKIG